MPGRPGGNTVWDKPEFLMELGIGFFSAAQASGGLSQEMRDAIIDHLEKQGFNVTWEAIRWDANVHEDILICLFQHVKPSTQDWINVMQDLQAMNYTFTESALRYGHV
ncbi:hypothetical protein BKA56DRAFT_671710 [Ilyonectria sp. MPI-CAGE-AT-0026]|nr:hypothetical protein BKA56DRAFT_671710 [Ilyonectria sp. MPI-CAGE-AT-0026]